MERFVFSADLIEAVRCGPGAVRGRQYRLVWERAGATFPERGQCLIEPAVIEKTEYKHGAGKFGTAVF